MQLASCEWRLLRDVRLADEDHGGLAGEALTVDEFEPMKRLCDLGLVEAVGAYGEAPDGEEDEREASVADGVVYRVTGAGVAVMRDALDSKHADEDVDPTVKASAWR